MIDFPKVLTSGKIDQYFLLCFEFFDAVWCYLLPACFYDHLSNLSMNSDVVGAFFGLCLQVILRFTTDNPGVRVTIIVSHDLALSIIILALGLSLSYFVVCLGLDIALTPYSLSSSFQAYGERPDAPVCKPRRLTTT